jgi:putative inorganic carbon (HCO3(-)) transporter
MILSRPLRISPAALKKAFAIGGGFFALLVLARYAMGSPLHGAEIALVALAPVGAYFGLTRPLLFPYGLYLLVVPFDPLFTFTGGPGTTLTRYLGIAVVAALVLRMILLRRAYAPPWSWYAWCAVLVVMIASTIWSIDATQTLGLSTMMLQLFALYTLLGIYPSSRADLLLVARLTAACGTIAAAYGLFAYASGTQRLEDTRLSIGSGSMHLDPNHYAAYFFIPAAVLVAWLLYESRISRRVGISLCLAAVVLNVLLTGSRGGLISVAIVLLYSGIRARKYLTAGLVSISAFALSLAVPNVWQRFTDASQSEGSGRGELWAVGLAALKHYWLLGSGFGTFEMAYDQYFLNAYQRSFQGWTRPAHDLLVQSSVELGIAGAALVVFAWFASFRQNANIRFGDALFPMRIASEAAILALFVEALTLDMLWYKYLWVALSFSLIVANAYRPRAFGQARLRPRVAPVSYARAGYARAGYARAGVAESRVTRTESINCSTLERLESTLEAPDI